MPSTDAAPDHTDSVDPALLRRAITGAAIGNAVARVLGRRVRDLPLTRERIMATLLSE